MQTIEYLGLVGLAAWAAWRWGSAAAENRFPKADAARYAALRRRSVRIDDGPPLLPHQIDAAMDVLVLRDAIERTMNSRPNAEVTGPPPAVPVD